MKINSTELLFLHTTPSMFGACSEVGDFMKNILYRFIAAQTHFGMPRGAQMSLALN
jgi:hypothetical protein